MELAFSNLPDAVAVDRLRRRMDFARYARDTARAVGSQLAAGRWHMWSTKLRDSNAHCGFLHRAARWRPAPPGKVAVAGVVEAGASKHIRCGRSCGRAMGGAAMGRMSGPGRILNVALRFGDLSGARARQLCRCVAESSSIGVGPWHPRWWSLKWSTFCFS